MKTNDLGMFLGSADLHLLGEVACRFFEPSIPLSLHVLHELHGEFALFSGLNCGI
jgi:hypothetical protein